MDVSAQAETGNLAFLCLFDLLRPPMDWTMLTHIGEDDPFLPSILNQIQTSSRDTSQTHPEIMFTSYLGIP